MNEENGTDLAVQEEQKAKILANIKIVGGSLVLTSGDQLWWLANRVVSGGLAPKGMEKVETVFLAMLAGMDVGLNPMQSMQGIMVVNNRTTIWGDVALALCQASPLCGGIKEWSEGEGEDYVAICECIRKDWPEPVRRTFSYEWAKKAGLLTRDTYQKYLFRMLQMRARAFALRDAYSDVLKGMGITEEAQDYIDVTASIPETKPEGSKPEGSKPKDLKDVAAKLDAEAKEFAAGQENAPQEAGTAEEPPTTPEPEKAPERPKRGRPKKKQSHDELWVAMNQEIAGYPTGGRLLSLIERKTIPISEVIGEFELHDGITNETCSKVHITLFDRHK